MKNEIEFTRVNNDVNGNPRYVCHFLNFITEKDRQKDEEKKIDKYGLEIKRDIFGIDNLYNIALKRAKQLGGRKFHNKQYGGGIVFQSYNIQETEKEIHELLKNLDK